MNGHGTEPPDKHKFNAIALKNALISCGMQIKLKPTVKQESESLDEISMVSRPIHSAIGSLDNSIGGEEADDSDDCFGFYDLDEMKSEVKIEKMKEEANQVPRLSSNKDERLKSNAKKRFPKAKSGGSNHHCAAKKFSAKTGKSGKAKSFGINKVLAEGKANGKRHKCSLCDYCTFRKSVLTTHMLKHTGERPIGCSVCQKRFTTKRSLKSHMKRHVDAFLFSCSNCLQGFHHSEQKVEHEFGCKVRRYECHLCKEFSTLDKRDLKRHVRVHTGERPFECDQCSKKFKQSNALKCHHKTHVNPRPLKFKCSPCFRNFAQQKEKEDHEANCKRRGYRCHLCKSFTTVQKIHLMEHMRIHTGEKPFRCEICSKCFSQTANLNKHKKVHK